MNKATRNVLAFLVLAACGGDATAPTNTTGTGGTGSTGSTGGTTGGGTVTSAPVTMTASVTVTDDMFGPASVKVLKGGTVTWTWNSLDKHNVTFDSGETSGDLTGTATYEKTFTTTGTYSFQCTNHYSMTGVVIVQ